MSSWPWARAIVPLTIAWIVSVVAAVILIIGVIWSGNELSSNLDRSYCVESARPSILSMARTSKATLTEKICDGGADVDFSVRVDRTGSDRLGSWFVIIRIETDAYPKAAIPPTLKWIDNSALQINIPAITISGRITNRVDDVTVIRQYVQA